MNMVVDELDGGITNVTLRGRLDLLGAQTIDLPFSEIADSKNAVLVDLSEVDFLRLFGDESTADQRKGRPPQGWRACNGRPRGKCPERPQDSRV
jgi:anti-sigma B factor antagonist